MYSLVDLPQIERIFDCLPDVVFCVKNLNKVYQSVNQAFAARANADEKEQLERMISDVQEING